jgi:hypothetical protein
MEFNAYGQFQKESNTFWYMSVGLLDYMLRYFCLIPVDWLYHRHTTNASKRTGDLTIVCRAANESVMGRNDEWALESRNKSWEYITSTGRPLLRPWQKSTIDYAPTHHNSPLDPEWTSRVVERHIEKANGNAQTHTLRLADVS